MAEIHVQARKPAKRTSSWIWIVIGLLIAAAVIFYISTRDDRPEENQPIQNAPASEITIPAESNYL